MAERTDIESFKSPPISCSTRSTGSSTKETCGAFFAPILAAAGALAAVPSECSIEVERVAPDNQSNVA